MSGNSPRGNNASFVHHRIDVAFALGKGDFGNAGYNTLTLSGLTVQADIQHSGMNAAINMSMRVFGMSQEHMQQLSTLGNSAILTRNNAVALSAGNAGERLSLVFQGAISEAWIDMAGAPDVCLVVTAVCGGLEALRPVPASSYRGPADVAVVMADLARQMGMNFENNGVSVILSNPYYPGTAMDQARRAAEEAHIDMFVDKGDGAITTLVIVPKGVGRGGLIPLVSSATGMVGYPSYMQGAISLTTLYNPAIRLMGVVEVESILKGANGKWLVGSMTHNLQSETPGGDWFTHIYCSAFAGPARLFAQ